jgi:hypothetical protein
MMCVFLCRPYGRRHFNPGRIVIATIPRLPPLIVNNHSLTIGEAMRDI